MGASCQPVLRWRAGELELGSLSYSQPEWVARVESLHARQEHDNALSQNSSIASFATFRASWAGHDPRGRPASDLGAAASWAHLEPQREELPTDTDSYERSRAMRPSVVVRTR
jgi:hypothetical protein